MVAAIAPGIYRCFSIDNLTLRPESVLIKSVLIKSVLIKSVPIKKFPVALPAVFKPAAAAQARRINASVISSTGTARMPRKRSGVVRDHPCREPSAEFAEQPKSHGLSH